MQGAGGAGPGARRRFVVADREGDMEEGRGQGTVLRGRRDGREGCGGVWVLVCDVTMSFLVSLPGLCVD